jgi:hypothetical protein
MKYPVTPDGRYFVVKGRLWRCSDPSIAAPERARLVRALMQARRAVGVAKRAGAADEERLARIAVDAAKQALGERGPVWWTDGAPDYNRRLVDDTPYAAWFAGLGVDDADDSGERQRRPTRSAGRRSAPNGDRGV